MPLTTNEIAVAAKKACAAGASMTHVHVRDADGKPCADVDSARYVIERVQASCSILVQLSTDVGPGVPIEECAKLVELRPRMASVNTRSMTFGDVDFIGPPSGVRRLAARMREVGVKKELKVYDSGHVGVCVQLLKRGLLVEPL